MASDSEWIYVDLEEEFNITRVKILWDMPFPLEYKIQTSNDTYNWKTIFTADTGGTRLDDVYPLSGKGRYVRILCTKRISDTVGYSIWELEVYDSTKINGTDTGEYKPTKREILDCSPNPIEKNARIGYFLDKASEVRISVFDIKGNRVALLLEGEESEGYHQIGFNAESLPSGEYYCRIDIGNEFYTKKLIILK
jgi:hypothetical protein